MFLCDCPQHTSLGPHCGRGPTAMSAGGICFAISCFGWSGGFIFVWGLLFFVLVWF